MLNRFKDFLNSDQPAEIRAPAQSQSSSTEGPPHHPRRFIAGVVMALVVATLAVSTFRPQASISKMEVPHASAVSGLVDSSHYTSKNMTAADAASQSFAKYVASGKTNASLRVLTLDDASHVDAKDQHGGYQFCSIKSLETKAAAAKVGDHVDLDSKTLRAGLMIMDFTACQIKAHFNLAPVLPSAGAKTMTGEQIMAEQFKLSMVDFTADARSVFEIARKDGTAKAEEYVKSVKELRRGTSDSDPHVNLALDHALVFAKTRPGWIRTDRQSFERSMVIGKETAGEMIRSIEVALPKDQRVELNQDYAKAKKEVDDGLVSAMREYDSGLYSAKSVGVVSGGKVFDVSADGGKPHVENDTGAMAARINSLLGMSSRPGAELTSKASFKPS